MTAALVLCGGSGSRMGGIGINKTLLSWKGKPLFIHSVSLFVSLGMTVIVTAPEQELPRFRAALEAFSLQAAVVPGGSDRYLSVLCGLRSCPEGTENVLIHDGARPNITAGLVEKVLASVMEHGSGIPVLPCYDTVKTVSDSVITGTPDRRTLFRVQTPQGFKFREILRSYENHRDHSLSFTDDASVLEADGAKVFTVEGLPGNTKITTREDYALLNGNSVRCYSSGIGQDTHRLVEGRDLILCGVRIPFEKGLDGHSDADAATHALIDSLLGAAALGDIGQHFPDKDPAYLGVSSLKLLGHTVSLIREKGFEISHTDLTIICQRPKLAAFIPEMRRTLAERMAVPLASVSVKATTTEGLGYEGRGEGISALAVAALYHWES